MSNRTKLSGGTGDFKPTPNLSLTGAVGNKAIGVIQGRFETKTFPGKYSTLLSIIETNGSTTLYDKETKSEKEVDIEVGDKVFLQESTVLANALSQLKKGDKVEIIYTGLGERKPGRKPAYLYDIFKLEA